METLNGIGKTTFITTFPLNEEVFQFIWNCDDTLEMTGSMIAFLDFVLLYY